MTDFIDAQVQDGSFGGGLDLLTVAQLVDRLGQLLVRQYQGLVAQMLETANDSVGQNERHHESSKGDREHGAREDEVPDAAVGGIGGVPRSPAASGMWYSKVLGIVYRTGKQSAAVWVAGARRRPLAGSAHPRQAVGESALLGQLKLDGRSDCSVVVVASAGAPSSLASRGCDLRDARLKDLARSAVRSPARTRTDFFGAM